MVGTGDARLADEMWVEEVSRSMNSSTHLRMARVNQQSGHSKPSVVSRKLERKWFEFDRSAVQDQLGLVERAIDEHARDLGWVAAEGVFEKPLSGRLLRTSRALHSMAKELSALRGEVAKTDDYPKADKLT